MARSNLRQALAVISPTEKTSTEQVLKCSCAFSGEWREGTSGFRGLKLSQRKPTGRPQGLRTYKARHHMAPTDLGGNQRITLDFVWRKWPTLSGIKLTVNRNSHLLHIDPETARLQEFEKSNQEKQETNKKQHHVRSESQHGRFDLMRQSRPLDRHGMTVRHPE